MFKLSHAARTRVGVTLAALAINLIGPILVARSFLGAHDSNELEGAYFVGALIGQPLALLTCGIGLLLIALIGRAENESAKAVAFRATLASLPAAALLAWPQVGVLPIWIFFAQSNTITSWVLALVVGTALVSAVVFCAALIFGRAPTNRRIRSAVLGASVLPLLTILAYSPALVPMVVQQLPYFLNSLHLTARPSGSHQGGMFQHACGIANGRFMTTYVVSDTPAMVIRDTNTDIFVHVNPNPGPLAYPAGLLKAPCGVATNWDGDLFVSDSVTSNVLAFKDDGYGHTHYRGSLAGPVTGISHPRRLGLDGKANLYVLDSNAILVFRHGALGNVRPIRRIAGPALHLEACSGFGVDRAGEIIVKDCGSSTAPQPYLARFPAGADGNVTPNVTVAGPHTRLSRTMPITVDDKGDVVTLSDSQDVVVYCASDSGDTLGHTLLTGSLGVSNPTDIAIDERTMLDVADPAHGRVATFYIVGPSSMGATDPSDSGPMHDKFAWKCGDSTPA